MANWAIANKTGNLFDSKSVSYHINNLFKADLLLMQNQGRSRWIKLNLGDCSSSFVPLIGLEEHSLSASERLLLSVITNSACIYARAGYGFNVPVSSVNNINNHLLGTKVTAERCLDSLLEQELLSLSEDGTCYSIAETVSDRYSHLLKVDLSDNAKSCLDSTEVSKDSDFCHAVEPASPCTTSNSLQSVDYPQERTDNTKTPSTPSTLTTDTSETISIVSNAPKHADSESNSFTLNLTDSLLEILSTYRNSIQKNWSINNNVFKNEIKNGIKNNVGEKNFSASGEKIFRTQIFDELRNISANAHPRANAHHQSQQVSPIVTKQASTQTQVPPIDYKQIFPSHEYTDKEWLHELDHMPDSLLEVCKETGIVPLGYKKSPKKQLAASSTSEASEGGADSKQPAASSTSEASEGVADSKQPAASSTSEASEGVADSKQPAASSDDEANFNPIAYMCKLINMPAEIEEADGTVKQTALPLPSNQDAEKTDPISLVATTNPIFQGIDRANVESLFKLGIFSFDTEQLDSRAECSYQQAEHALSQQRENFFPDGLNASTTTRSPQLNSMRSPDFPFYMDYINGGH